MSRETEYSAPCEFGVKASIVTTNVRAPGGRFVLRARPLPGRSNLAGTSSSKPKMHRLRNRTGYVDKGYRGHNAQNPRRVFISGQKCGVFGVIKRELRRRSAIEPVIGYLKAEGHLGRCYLKSRAGYNIRRILAWLRLLCAYC
jgi:IS5 family transposase